MHLTEIVEPTSGDGPERVLALHPLHEMLAMLGVVTVACLALLALAYILNRRP